MIALSQPEIKTEVKPKQINFNCEDILPGSYLRDISWPEFCWVSVYEVTMHGVCVSCSYTYVTSCGAATQVNPLRISWDSLKNYWLINRSIPLTGKYDPAAWEPCAKEA